MQDFAQRYEVVLPEGDLVDSWMFTRSIARAFHPPLESAIGIACVIGKRKRVKNSPDLEFPYRISAEELVSLGDLLALLPPVRTGMADAELKDFFVQYDDLQDRPDWLPIIATLEDANLYSYRASALQAEHVTELQKCVDQRQVSLIGQAHRLTRAVAIGACLRRDDCVSYLKMRGIRVREIHSVEVALVPSFSAAKFISSQIVDQDASIGLPEGNEMDGVKPRGSVALQPEPEETDPVTKIDPTILDSLSSLAMPSELAPDTPCEEGRVKGLGKKEGVKVAAKPPVDFAFPNTLAAPFNNEVRTAARGSLDEWLEKEFECRNKVQEFSKIKTALLVKEIMIDLKQIAIKEVHEGRPKDIKKFLGEGEIKWMYPDEHGDSESFTRNALRQRIDIFKKKR